MQVDVKERWALCLKVYGRKGRRTGGRTTPGQLQDNLIAREGEE